MNRILIKEDLIETRNKKGDLTFSTDWKYLIKNSSGILRLGGSTNLTLPFSNLYDGDNIKIRSQFESHNYIKDHSIFIYLPKSDTFTFIEDRLLDSFYSPFITRNPIKIYKDNVFLGMATPKPHTMYFGFYPFTSEMHTFTYNGFLNEGYIEAEYPIEADMNMLFQYYYSTSQYPYWSTWPFIETVKYPTNVSIGITS